MSDQTRELPLIFCAVCRKEIIGTNVPVAMSSGDVFCGDKCLDIFCPKGSHARKVTVQLKELYTRQFTAIKRIRD